MKKLFLVTVVCSNDYAIALKRANWLKNLGQKPTHNLFLVSDGTVDEEAFNLLRDALKPSHAEIITRKMSSPKNSSWPFGVNHAYRSIVHTLTGKGCPIDIKPYMGWFFLEPDVTPLNKDWIEILEKQYIFQKKPFMGAKSVVFGTKSDGTKVTIECMNGAGIYPFEPGHYSPAIMLSDGIPWDVAGLGIGYQHKIAYIPNTAYVLTYGVTQCTKTQDGLIHATKTVQDGTVSETSFKIDGALLHHGCKDGTLIDILLAGHGVQRDSATGVIPIETSGQQIKAKTGPKPKKAKVVSPVVHDVEGIVQDFKTGLSWFKLVGKYKISPVDLKQILAPHRS